MFYLISLGLCDESDITLRGLTTIQRCSRVYLEAYTSIFKLMVPQPQMVESSADEISKDADEEDVALLVVGDPFG
ncbi:hypothetical protein JOM56_013538 [Amanita muscaria]